MDLITIISYICTASVGFGLAVVAAIVRLRRCTAGVVTYGKAVAVAAGLLIAANVGCVAMTLPVPIGVAMAVADVAAVAAVLLMPIHVRGSEEQSAQPADAADDVPPTVAAAPRTNIITLTATIFLVTSGRSQDCSSVLAFLIFSIINITNKSASTTLPHTSS